MNKTDRQKIFDKYGGMCAYCGCELGKRWCVDHVEPIYRLKKSVGNNYVNKETGYPATEEDIKTGNYEWVPLKYVPDGCQNPELDTIENSSPACFSCNNYKSTFGLELFREQIGLLVGRLNKSFTQYKIAKRYGLVQETGIEVQFYFETLKGNK